MFRLNECAIFDKTGVVGKCGIAGCGPSGVSWIFCGGLLPDCSAELSQTPLRNCMAGSGLEDLHRLAESGEASIFRLPMVETVINLLDNAGQPEQAVDVVEGEILNLEISPPEVSGHNLVPGKGARGGGGNEPNRLQSREIVRLDPVRQ